MLRIIFLSQFKAFLYFPLSFQKSLLINSFANVWMFFDFLNLKAFNPMQLYWLKDLAKSSMILSGLCSSGEVTNALIFIEKISSSDFLSRSHVCCWVRSLFFSSSFAVSLSLFVLIIPFHISLSSKDKKLLFFPSFIFLDCFLSSLSAFSSSGETNICKHIFSSVNTLEYADRILSIGSASKTSQVLIGYALSFAKTNSHHAIYFPASSSFG